MNCINYFLVKVTGGDIYNRDGGGSALSLGSVGTRRTVYLSEEDPPTITNPQMPPLLVYNKISTTIGESSKPPQKQTESTTQEERSFDQKKDSSKENAVWYEYGCV